MVFSLEVFSERILPFRDHTISALYFPQIYILQSFCPLFFFVSKRPPAFIMASLLPLHHIRSISVFSPPSMWLQPFSHLTSTQTYSGCWWSSKRPQVYLCLSLHEASSQHFYFSPNHSFQWTHKIRTVFFFNFVVSHLTPTPRMCFPTLHCPYTVIPLKCGCVVLSSRGCSPVEIRLAPYDWGLPQKSIPVPLPMSFDDINRCVGKNN